MYNCPLLPSAVQTSYLAPFRWTKKITLSFAISPSGSSQLKQLRHHPQSFIGVFHSMPNGPAILINLIIVAALETLVAEKVDVLVVDAAQ